MFKKPIRIKSNTQVKASERKIFKDLLLKVFPNLSEAEFNEFLPKKEVLNSLKVVTHDNAVVQVYTVQKRPMVFDIEGHTFPTVFLLWRFPNIIPVFTTHQQVMNNISSGADLMLPGVVTPPAHSGLSKYGSVSENDAVYVNLSTNKAAIAVGVAGQSSASMLANSRGKCVIIHHFYGDHLCTLEGMPPLPIANLGPPRWLKLNNFDEDFPELGSKRSESVRQEVHNEIQEEIVKNVEEYFEETYEQTDVIKSDENPVETVEDIDKFFCYCFLGAIKYSKQLILPVLTSNFYKLHMVPVCPENKTLDIKKTSYKKLKVFLEKMAEEGIITVKEVKKGVEAITAINQNHPKYAEFYISRENRPSKALAEEENAISTDIVESYIVSQNVLPIFKVQGYQKGDTVQRLDVRKCVTKYVKDNNFQDENNPRLVKPDNEVLLSICKTESPVTWEELIEKICDVMKSCYKVKTANQEIVNKGKVSPITISVSVRSGNKKVTLVDNLELFGIRIAEFSKDCQHGVAASTSISRPPGKKSDQLLVQGNQVIFVYNLLTDKYKVPKKYIKGLENAPKKKK